MRRMAPLQSSEARVSDAAFDFDPAERGDGQVEDASSVVRNHGRSPDQPAREKAAISVSAFADALETATTSDAAVVRGRAQLEILEVLRVEARALALRQSHLATGLPAAELQPALKVLREVKMVTAPHACPVSLSRSKLDVGLRVERFVGPCVTGGLTQWKRNGKPQLIARTQGSRRALQHLT